MRRFLVGQVAALVAALTLCAAMSGPASAGGLALSPSGATLYAADGATDAVSVIDTATDTATRTIPVGSNPQAVALSADGDTLYVANAGDADISVIDTVSDQVVDTIPVGAHPQALVLSPDGTTLYVGNRIDGTISAIDTATNQVTATFAAGDAPCALVISPDGEELYAADSSGQISVLSTQTDTVALQFNTGESAVAIALSPNGSELYVADLDAAVINMYDTATGDSDGTVDDNFDQPTALALGANGHVLYVGGEHFNSVDDLDTSSDTWVGTQSVGLVASSLLVDAATGTLYSSDGGNDTPAAAGVLWEGTAGISLPVSESAPVAGQTLTADPVGWLPMDDLTYQWIADGQDIPGATSSTLALTSDDVGEQISVQVTGDTGTQTSAATAAVTPAPPAPPQQTTTSTTPSPTTTTPSPTTTTPETTPTPIRTPTPTPTHRAKPKPKHMRAQRVSVKLTGVAGGDTYFGAAPDPRCVVHANYGHAHCRISSHTSKLGSGAMVRFTARASGSAGARAVTSVTVRTTALRLRGLHETHGVFVAKLGGIYSFEVASRTQPLYVDAAVAPAQPQGTHAWFKRAGTLDGLPLWKLPVYLPAGLADFKLWRIGMKLDGQMQVITIRT